MASVRGNLLIGQSGGPTAVVNASLVGVLEEARRHDSIGTLYGARFGVLGLLHDDLVDLGQLSAQELARLRRTPSAALGSSRTSLTDSDVDRILAILRARQIHYFLFIGGNGSVQTALRVHRLRQTEAFGLPLPTAYVFTSVDGGAIEPTALLYHFKRLLTKAGLPDFRFHDLPHS